MVSLALLVWYGLSFVTSGMFLTKTSLSLGMVRRQGQVVLETGAQPLDALQGPDEQDVS